MDANEVWQENKRFIITVGSGLLVFLFGQMVVEGLYVPDIQASNRTTASARAKLKDEMFSWKNYEVNAENLSVQCHNMKKLY